MIKKPIDTSPFINVESMKTLSHNELVDVFWQELINWQKTKSERSASIVRRAFLWAVHDNRELAKSFLRAMNWVGLPVYEDKAPKGEDA